MPTSGGLKPLKGWRSRLLAGSLLALMVVVFSNDIARKWGSLSQIRLPG